MTTKNLIFKNLSHFHTKVGFADKLADVNSFQFTDLELQQDTAKRTLRQSESECGFSKNIFLPVPFPFCRSGTTSGGRVRALRSCAAPDTLGTE